MLKEPVRGVPIETVAYTQFGVDPQAYTADDCLKLLHIRHGKGIELELGGGRNFSESGETFIKPFHATLGLNPSSDPMSDFYWDLEYGIPLPTDSVDMIFSNQTLEHVANQILLMNECWRVLKPGGTFEACVPHWQSPYADGDPTHKVRFTEASFQYYCLDKDGRPFVSKFSDYGIKSKFVLVKHEVRPRVDITVKLKKPRLFVPVDEGRYKVAQDGEIKWWQNANFNPQVEWGYYTKHFEPYFSHGRKVADVGCGPVPYFCNGAVEFSEATAIDPLIEQYLQIEKYDKARGETPFSTCADIYRAKSCGFDTVFCLNTLDHVQDPQAMIRQLTRITCGKLFLFVDIDKSPDRMHPHLITKEWLVEELEQDFETWYMHTEKSWKFKNDVLYYVGDKIDHTRRKE